MKAQNNFIENLANRTVGLLPDVTIRPAIAPDMLPGTFAGVSHVAPQLPAAPTWPAPTARVHAPKHVDVAGAPQDGAEHVRENADPVEKTTAETRKASEERVVTKRPGPELHPPEPAPDAGPSVTPVQQGKGQPMTERQPQHDTTALVKKDGTAKREEPMPKIETSTDKIAVGHGKAPSPEVPTPTTGTSNAVNVHAADYKAPPFPAEREQKSPVNPAMRAEKFVKVAIGPAVEKDDLPTTDQPTSVQHARPPGLPQGSAKARSATLAQDSSAGTAPAEDTVTINIGRIEVRAVFPQQAKPASKPSGISLAEYLKMRAEGRI